jgi:hypothetical protein
VVVSVVVEALRYQTVAPVVLVVERIQLEAQTTVSVVLLVLVQVKT